MLKVVIVDDEPWVLEGLRTMVDWSRFHFEICGEALNGPDALKLIQELKPDLVLTDINIPEMTGLELIAKLNESMDRPPRFVILSGYDDFQYARVALRQRVEQYLLKPVDDEEMEELLGRLSVIIQNEIASNNERGKKQTFITNHLINRLIQGEADEQLQLMASSLLRLQPDAELVCIMLAASSAINLDGELNRYFPAEAACSFQDGAGRAGIIVQSGPITQENLAAAVTQLAREQSERLQVPVIALVSDRMHGGQSIRELYNQTLEAWKLKCHKEKGGVFYYCDLKRTGSGQKRPDGRGTNLLETVKAGDLEQIRFSVEELFARFAGQLMPVEAVQAQAAHLEMTLCRLITEANGDPAVVMNRLQAACGSLGELSNYSGLSHYMLTLCTQSAAYLAELRRHNEGNTIFNVIQYVDLEFRSKLQLQELARKFHMNSAYLGQLFRKETGRSFSEYVNEKRIEEAKGLLKRTQLKISDIALQVGFSNTDYFIDKFKAVVGVVPSAYKNSHNCK
ncbi:DNA-binding response regulator [Paenibacillus sp. PK3_47]|uniref:response regulator transcription factor n=1 Tax=Paenibacillus sp. PK3_47 TaxID=2072642 RepID=UPI00201E0CD8|nr:response regulator [Paenibacillus sp. PK3_47]UQZ33488.1 DNA-binding response regulator [Paenibacillus sp. PK3_47]